MSFALGRLGWAPTTFWAATPREIAAAFGPTTVRRPLRTADLQALIAAFPDLVSPEDEHDARDRRR